MMMSRRRATLTSLPLAWATLPAAFLVLVKLAGWPAQGVSYFEVETAGSRLTTGMMGSASSAEHEGSKQMILFEE
jgi:hypothetical protein